MSCAVNWVALCVCHCTRKCIPNKRCTLIERFIKSADYWFLWLFGWLAGWLAVWHIYRTSARTRNSKQREHSMWDWFDPLIARAPRCAELFFSAKSSHTLSLSSFMLSNMFMLLHAWLTHAFIRHFSNWIAALPYRWRWAPKALFEKTNPETTRSTVYRVHVRSTHKFYFAYKFFKRRRDYHRRSKHVHSLNDMETQKKRRNVHSATCPSQCHERHKISRKVSNETHLCTLTSHIRSSSIAKSLVAIFDQQYLIITFIATRDYQIHKILSSPIPFGEAFVRILFYYANVPCHHHFIILPFLASRELFTSDDKNPFVQTKNGIEMIQSTNSHGRSV